MSEEIHKFSFTILLTAVFISLGLGMAMGLLISRPEKAATVPVYTRSISEVCGGDGICECNAWHERYDTTEDELAKCLTNAIKELDEGVEEGNN